MLIERGRACDGEHNTAVTGLQRKVFAAADVVRLLGRGRAVSWVTRALLVR